MRKKIVVITSVILILVISSALIGIFVPRLNKNGDNPYYNDFEGMQVAKNSAATYQINESVVTNFGIYTPNNINYSPQKPSYIIKQDLSEVDFQGISIDEDIISQLSEFGFALKETEYNNYPFDMAKCYPLIDSPNFITADVCLHMFHLLFDASLRLIEENNFTVNFIELLEYLQDEQIEIYNKSVNENIKWAAKRTTAYLTVILSLLDNTTFVPDFCTSMVTTELDNINNTQEAVSPIFDYNELYSLYEVRGHYTSTDLLSRYFKAMLYAGRMGFKLQDSLNHSRMALLLVNSFNSVNESENIWSLWESIYEPIGFYVGESDELTIRELTQAWESIGSPNITQLEDNETITVFMDEIVNYTKPTVNTMLITALDGYENNTQIFSLFGQKFIPDTYIFQELMDGKIPGRLLPNGLDIFSVLGSTQAEYHLRNENDTYPNYNSQIQKLRAEFGDLNETAWTQNLYWLWIYTLMPLLYPASTGYPTFMLNDAWTSKSLMTTLGSWVELRHDTILYAKEAWIFPGIGDYVGYVEPYPELYGRLSSLIQYLIDGLVNRSLAESSFIERCVELKTIYERLAEISIKILENQDLSESDNHYLIHFGPILSHIYSSFGVNYTITKDRTALIADVAGYSDGAVSNVLQVAIGDPYFLYVIIPDNNGQLKLTRGFTFSYYEFIQPTSQLLNDENWQIMLDTNPPDKPNWIIESLPIIYLMPQTILITFNIRKSFIDSKKSKRNNKI
ncbi:MAG: DUF3160 domain-containing protein [Asgard group archaeon]|nr:DUF3160 domain-containing protein [Asgard group archaeon]